MKQFNVYLRIGLSALSIFYFLVCSCQQPIPSNESSSQSEDSLQTAILSQVVAAVLEECCGGESIMKEFKPPVVTQDSIEYVYSFDRIEPTGFTGADAFDVYIRNKTILGDINGDNQEDCILNIVSSNPIGGNSVFSYFVVLINHDQSYIVSKAYDDAKVKPSLAPNSAGLTISSIGKGGVIKGVYSEYKEDDIRCCPSIKHVVELKYQNGEIFKIKDEITN